MGRGMSNSAAISATALFAQDFTGARALRKPGEEAGTVSLSSDWSFGYEELFRPVCHGTGAIFGSIAYHHSSPSFFQKVVDALPIAPHETPSEFMSSLQAIERCLS